MPDPTPLTRKMIEWMLENALSAAELHTAVTTAVAWIEQNPSARSAPVPRATLATRANMQKWADAHPSQEAPSGGIIHPPTLIAYSPVTGEEYSATAGDYFQRLPNVPLRDATGEPMVLVVKREVYVPAEEV